MPTAKLSMRQLNQLISRLHFQWSWLLIGLTVLVVGWLGYHVYSNVYKVAIQPRELDQSEIVSRRQRVNIELFQAIQQAITEKQGVSLESLRQTPNPFR